MIPTSTVLSTKMQICENGDVMVMHIVLCVQTLCDITTYLPVVHTAVHHF